MMSGDSGFRPKATAFIILLFAFLVSVISVTRTHSILESSHWLSSSHTTQGDDHYLPRSGIESAADYSTVSSKTQQKAIKTIINRDKASTKGLHLCTCLNNDDLLSNNIPPPPKRIRWLHFPKTGTSFISTLWSYSTSTNERYIDLNLNSEVCTHNQHGLSMYDFALMRRYPWEMYGAPNLLNPNNNDDNNDAPLGLVGGTQHTPLSPNLKDNHFLQSDRYANLVNKKRLMRYGSEVWTHNMTVVAFFRQPEERIISALKDSYHANGFVSSVFQDLVSKVQGTKKNGCKIGNHTYDNPAQCFANYPGIAGCMARMLTGEKCADSVFSGSGLENVAEAVDIILNHLEFVGLTEDWNESVCQFHRLFSGRISYDNISGQRLWEQPLQREFANVHKSTVSTASVEQLHGFKDVADTVVYEAAKLKFERMVGAKRCHKFMSWDEIEREIIKDDSTSTPYLNVDNNGNVCHRLTCSDLGKQCGEWDDGCGSTVICGMCDAGRSGLPSTWRVQCVEGKCVDYCPTWSDKGLWFLSNNSPPIMKKVADSIETREQKYLSPIEALKLCDIACQVKANNATASDGIEAFIDDTNNLCQCGTTTKVFQFNLTVSDFSSAHDMMATCSDGKVLKSLKVLSESDSQPICCPYRDDTTLLKGKEWKRLYTLGGPKLEGSYFAHIPMECGGLDECEHVAKKRGAEIAVFDIINSYCHLAKNVFELDNLFNVAKDNSRRFILDLRNR
jgi:hypothetical protein